MNARKILSELNVVNNCRKLDIGLWSCPQFIFVVMGIVTGFIILASYFVGQKYVEPEITILIVTLLTVFLLIISYVLVSAFKRVVESKEDVVQHARELAELKDQFVYIAVHNLRAPATAIKWGLHVIEPKLEELGTFEEEALGIIRMSNERILMLVHDLLLITRLERDEVSVSSTALDAASLIDQQIAFFDDAIKKNGCKYTRDIPANLAPFYGDDESVKKIFSILLNNAIASSDKNNPVIAIHALQKKEELILSFENNGPGIPISDRQHVFSKFWKSSDQSEYTKTGFSLYLARELMRLMGGVITFSSIPGKTIFQVSFPLRSQS